MNNKQNNDYYGHTRSEMRVVVPGNYSSVLEIGCGQGEFKQSLKPGVEYWGIEPNKQSAKKASQALSNVLVGDFNSCEKGIHGKQFDLIICNDVIEHMDDYERFLVDIKKYLSPNGYLVASIPNVRYLDNLLHLLFQKDWHYREAGILDKTHLRFFTKKSLLRTLNELDWDVTLIKGINRYGSNRFGPRLVLSYLGQLLFGTDSAYMQYAIQVKVRK